MIYKQKIILRFHKNLCQTISRKTVGLTNNKIMIKHENFTATSVVMISLFL
jgi:hypothetical protein